MVVRSLEDARDRESVRRVVGGDEMAFRDLCNRYGPSAKSLALRVVRQPFLAEEIVQDAFLALWRDREPTGKSEVRSAPGSCQRSITGPWTWSGAKRPSGSGPASSFR